MKSRFTQEEVMRIVQESRSEGVAVAARLHNISEQTIYNWRKRFGITDVHSRIGELKRLTQENARLKRLVAERDLEIDMMKEFAGKNVASLSERQEAESRAPWSEISRRAAFAGFSEDEMGAGNKT